MPILMNIVMVLQVLAALGVIGLVLIQHGKGADMGAAFGSGSSGSLFGATGSANFLSRTTAALAAVFFASTLALAFASHKPVSTTGGSVMDAPASVVPGAAAPASTTPPAESSPNASGANQGGTSGQTGEIPK